MKGKAVWTIGKAVAILMFVAVLPSCIMPPRTATLEYTAPGYTVPKISSARHVGGTYALLPLPCEGIKLEDYARKMTTIVGGYVQILIGRPVVDLVSEWWNPESRQLVTIPEQARSDAKSWVDKQGLAGWLEVELVSNTFNYKTHMWKSIPFAVLSLGLIDIDPTIESEVTVRLALVEAETGKKLAESYGSAKTYPSPLDINEDDPNTTLATAQGNMRSAIAQAVTRACKDLEKQLP